MKKAEKGLFVVLEEDERSKGVESEEQGQKKRNNRKYNAAKQRINSMTLSGGSMHVTSIWGWLQNA